MDKNNTPSREEKEKTSRERFLLSQANRMKREIEELARKHGRDKILQIMEEKYGWRGKLAAHFLKE